MGCRVRQVPLKAEDIETSFRAMYSELSVIQDPTLVKEILEEILTDHPLVSGADGDIDISGNVEEGIAFTRDYARRCHQLLGTPEDFFLNHFHWEAHRPALDSPEVEELAKGMATGRSYLVKEYGKSKQTYMLFKQLADRGFSGLCVSRTKPTILETEYGFGNIESKWLTDIYLTENNLINPTNVAQINIIVKDFMKHNDRGTILLEGIEYLIYYNGNDSIIKLLFSLNENVMVSESMLGYMRLLSRGNGRAHLMWSMPPSHWTTLSTPMP
jgi:hypothetical protein